MRLLFVRSLCMLVQLSYARRITCSAVWFRRHPEEELANMARKRGRAGFGPCRSILTFITLYVNKSRLVLV